MEVLEKIPLDKLEAGKFWVRDWFNPHEFETLKKSIKERGDVDSAPIVRAKNDGKYEIIIGHLRIKAAKDAGLKAISCRIKKVDDATAWSIAFADEIHEPWTPMAKARALKKMREEDKLPADEIARITRLTKLEMSRYMDFNEFPIEVQVDLDEGKIGLSHAIELLPLKDKAEELTNIATKVVVQDWPVQKLREEIPKILNPIAERTEIPVSTSKSDFGSVSSNSGKSRESGNGEDLSEEDIQDLKDNAKVRCPNCGHIFTLIPLPKGGFELERIREMS